MEKSSAPLSRSRKTSLRARIIFATCVVGVLINLFIIFIWVPRVQDILRTVATQDARNQTEITAASLVPFLLSNELSGVYQTLNGVLEREPDWHGLTLVNDMGVQLFPLTPIETSLSSGMAPITADIHFNNRTIAKLSVQIDLRRQLARIDREGITLAMTLTLLVTVLLAGFLLALEAWITRPVRHLAEAALALRNGNFAASLPDSPLSDIDDLASSFDAMRKELSQTQQGLEDARQAAEKTADIKTRILSTISHEMRTPLNGMLGVATLLQSTQQTPEQEGYARTIHDLGSTLLWQVEDILSAARFEANGIVPRLAPVNINDVAQSIIRGLEVLARGNGSEIRFIALPDRQASIRSDGAFLHHILQNLLSNASKFTHGGTITVALNADLSDQRLILTVSDTGPGIAPDVIGSIFDDFVSVSPDPTKLQKGTGLGLGIVRRMVEALNGKIEVTSSPGQGASFKVSLPYEPVKIDVHPKSGPRQMDDEELLGKILQQAPMKPPRILVVEDNATNMMILVRLFQAMGFETDEAENGFVGYEKTIGAKYFLIVTDQQMPLLSGRDMARKIREDHDNQNTATPIILVSANTFPDHGESDEYFNASLLKPVRRENFIACIADIFLRRKSADADLGPGMGLEDDLFQPDVLQQVITHSGPERAQEWLGMLEGSVLDIMSEASCVETTEDRLRLAALVHREISSALYLGFARLAQILRNLEGHLRNEDLLATSEAISLLKTTWEQTRALDIFDGHL